MEDNTSRAVDMLNRMLERGKADGEKGKKQTVKYELEEVEYREWECKRCGAVMKIRADKRPPTACYVCGSRHWGEEEKRGARGRRGETVKYAGQELSVREWGELNGIGYRALLHRLRSGWDMGRAMVVPEGWNRPHRCFYKGPKGNVCYRNGIRGKCDRRTEAEMLGCPYFYEFQKGDAIPEPPKRRRRSSFKHFRSVKEELGYGKYP